MVYSRCTCYLRPRGFRRVVKWTAAQPEAGSRLRCWLAFVAARPAGFGSRSPSCSKIEDPQVELYWLCNRLASS